MSNTQEKFNKFFILWGKVSLVIFIVLSLSTVAAVYVYNHDLRKDSNVTISQNREILEKKTEDPSDLGVSITRKEFGRAYIDLSYNTNGKWEQVNDKINVWFKRNSDRHIYSIEIIHSDRSSQIIRLYLDPVRQ